MKAVLQREFYGFAPGTEFAVLRRHYGGGQFLVSPLADRLRGIVIPADYLVIQQ